MSTSPTATRNQPKFSLNRIVIGVGGAILVLLFCGLGILWYLNGQAIAGEEFCPQTFQLRDFHYRRLPGLRTIVTPTTLTLKSTPVSTPVLQYIKRLPGERWDIVHVSEGVKKDIRAAQILIQALSATTPTGSFWDDWSKLHPELAAVTWPIVQRAAVQGEYEIIPSILESALEVSTSSPANPDSFANRWNPVLDKPGPDFEPNQ